MTNFEFTFSLFGLLLGLSLAELLGGFARSLQKRGKLKIGWLLPLLGLLGGGGMWGLPGADIALGDDPALGVARRDQQDADRRIDRAGFDAIGQGCDLGNGTSLPARS